MPILPTKILTFNNLLDILDIDEGVKDKREVPVNMVFVGTNELSKDTGIENFANTGTGIVQSLYSFVKKNGTRYLIRNLGTVLQKYNPSTGNFEDFKINLSDGKMFGYKEYDDWLYMGNGYNNYMRWDGTNPPTEYPSAPKGNILEVFEDRMFVAGSPTEPLSVYYSNTGDPTTFPSANVIKVPGTDKVTGLVNYYGVLIILKEKSVWKMQFIWEPNSSQWIPKIDALSLNHGCVSPKAYCWVENDVWFFTGKEVRRIGWLKGEGVGVMGFDPTSLSEQIKEALKRVNLDYVNKSAVFYHDKKFYLAVPLDASTFNNVVFVCHLLYKKNWTKLIDRPKAKTNCFVVHNNEVYSASSEEEGRVFKWHKFYNDNNQPIVSYVSFKALGSENFLTSLIYKFIDVEFKNIPTLIKITLFIDDFDVRRKRIKTFNLFIDLGSSLSTIGEISIGELLIGDGIGEGIEEIEYFKRRIALLERGQSMKIKIENDRKENFVLSRLSVGLKEKSKKFTKYI